MSLDDLRFSHSEQDFQPLGEWAKRLSVPAKTLLHHGSQGDLRLFTLPPREVDYYSVHEDFVGNGDLSLPYEAQPISMPEPGVMGLVVPNDDLAELAAGRRVELKFFSAIIRKQTIWGNIIQPIAGRLGSSLRPEGWRIAGYKRITSTEQGTWDVHSPVVVKLSAVNIYARDVDVEDFVSRLRSYQFIADVFPGDRIVDELPPYVSGKFRELIDANSLFWRNADGIDAPERERRRGEVLKYFKEDFLGLCDKKTNPTSLLKFAASACDPTLVPPSQQLLSTSVTPAMLALLTAAKLYWSAHCKYGQTRETYPDQEALLSFLRFMGLQEGNTAASGRTLIRPEGVPTPVPQKDWLTTVKLKRQWLGR
jgi:hypothetical protein